MDDEHKTEIDAEAAIDTKDLMQESPVPPGSAEVHQKSEEKIPFIDSEIPGDESQGPGSYRTPKNNSTIEFASGVKIFISLKSLNGTSFKNINSPIEESLRQRQSEKESKINSMRLKHKAQQIDKIKEVPTINHKSRKILENKGNFKLNPNQNLNSDDEDTLVDYLPGSSVSGTFKRKKVSQEELIKLNLLKSAMKLREGLKGALPEPEKNKLNLLERSKAVKDKIEKKREEFEKEKAQKELENCTFKPNIIKKLDLNPNKKPIKRTESAPIVNEEIVAQNVFLEFNYRVPPPSSFINVIEKSPKNLKGPIISSRYSQITPVQVSARYPTGYNKDAIISKAKPMVDYKLLVNN
jgi:hypothetical protein